MPPGLGGRRDPSTEAMYFMVNSRPARFPRWPLAMARLSRALAVERRGGPADETSSHPITRIERRSRRGQATDRRPWCPRDTDIAAQPGGAMLAGGVQVNRSLPARSLDDARPFARRARRNPHMRLVTAPAHAFDLADAIGERDSKGADPMPGRAPVPGLLCGPLLITKWPRGLIRGQL